MLMLFGVLFTHGLFCIGFLQNNTSSEDVSTWFLNLRRFSVDLPHKVKENFCYIDFRLC